MQLPCGAWLSPFLLPEVCKLVGTYLDRNPVDSVTWSKVSCSWIHLPSSHRLPCPQTVPSQGVEAPEPSEFI